MAHAFFPFSLSLFYLASPVSTRLSPRLLASLSFPASYRVLSHIRFISEQSLVLLRDFDLRFVSTKVVLKVLFRFT